MNPVCGSGGNFSSPLSWHTVASLLSSALPQNATEFNTTLAAFHQTAQWVEDTDNYWLDHLSCVGELVHRNPSAQLEEQANNFNDLISVTMRLWEFWMISGRENPQELLNATRLASKAASLILASTSTSAPELAILPALDVAMLGLTANIGMLGFWITQEPHKDLCQVATQAEEAVGEMLEVVEELMIAVVGGSAEIVGWPQKIVLCTAGLDPFPEECGQPIPYPFYWVGDGYLGENVFFGEEEAARQFQAEYKAAIEAVILSLEASSISGVATLANYTGWVYWTRMEACFAK